jgi:hypothetical protein
MPAVICASPSVDLSGPLAVRSQVATNPLVVMTVLGLAVNGILKLSGENTKLPTILTSVLSGLGAIFPSGSLLLLGSSMAVNGGKAPTSTSTSSSTSTSEGQESPIMAVAMTCVMKLAVLPFLQFLFCSALGGDVDICRFAFIVGEWLG